MEKFKLISFLKSIFLKYKLASFFLIISIIGVSLSSVIPSLVYSYIIDTYLSKSFMFDELSNKIVAISFLYFSTYLFIALMTFIENYAINYLGQKIIHHLRYLMIEKVSYLKTSYFSKHPTGESTSRVNDDVYVIESLFSNGLVELIISLFKIVSILVSIFVFSYLIGLFFLVLIPLIYVITHIFKKRMLSNQLINRKLINNVSNTLSEDLSNLLTLRNLNKEKYIEKEFSKKLYDSYNVSIKTSFYDAIFPPLIEIIKTSLIAIIVVLIIYNNKINLSAFNLTLGNFTALLTLISNLFEPLSNIGQELQTMQEGLSGIKRVESFLNEEEKVKENNLITINDLNSNDQDIIKIENLTFSYDNKNNVLQNINLNIKRYDKVTIIGRTGAGKTTLFKLITGLYEPNSGKVLINNLEACKIPSIYKRYLFSYVEQGFKPVNGTIMDQITLKDKSITIDQVISALKITNLYSYVNEKFKMDLQQKYYPEDFSYGQQQLLALARGLVFNPQILLLDEISANLDSLSEKSLLKAINLVSKKMTIISISHRLSTKLGFTKTIKIVNMQAKYN